MRQETPPTPLLYGGAAHPLLQVPILTGTRAKGSGGSFAELVSFPYELNLEDDAGTTAQVLVTGAGMATVIEEINAQAPALVVASESEGCLRLTGTGLSLRINAVTSGNESLAAALGFEAYPHPAGISHVGDPYPAPVRASGVNSERNGPLTALLARGDERAAASANRAPGVLLAAHSRHDAAMRQRTPVLQRIAVDLEQALIDGGALADADGFVDQISLEGFGDAVWVGGLTGASSKKEIASWFAVLDGLAVPAVAWRDGEVLPVRVAAVTRGPRSTAIPRPVFSEDETPSGGLPDTDGSLDGNNALGVAAVLATADITGVRDGCLVACESATFVTAGVLSGDAVTVSGGEVERPYSHNGEWVVHTVVSETELLLRPSSPTSPQRLNGSDAGAFGQVEVRLDGRFGRGLWVTLDPPLPRAPEGGLYLVAAVPSDTLAPATHSAEVQAVGQDGAGAVARASQGLAQALQGPGQGLGGSATVTRPAYLRQGQAPASSSSRTLVREGTGALFGMVLRADAADSFSSADLGRAVELDGRVGVYWVERILDGAHAQLRPPYHHAYYEGTTESSIDYALYDAQAPEEIPAVLSVVAPAVDSAGDNLSAASLLLVREQSDTGTDATVPGTSILALERVRLDAAGNNILEVAYTAALGSASLLLPSSPEEMGAIFATTATETAGDPMALPGTLCRILAGPDAGWYRVQTTEDSTPSVTLRTLTGGTPVLQSVAGTCSFYRPALASGYCWRGAYGGLPYLTGLHVSVDLAEAAAAGGAAITTTWRGEGAGLYVEANDQVLAAYDRGGGADGWGADLLLSRPAHGMRIRVYGGTSGTEDRRSARGLHVQTRSEVYLLTEHSNTDSLLAYATDLEYSAAGWFHNAGHDPGLVVTQTTSHAPAELGDPSGAAVVIRTERVASTGIWGALDVAGPVYQHSGTPRAGAAGIYTEGGVGAGRWLSPHHRWRRDASTVAYDDTSGLLSPQRTRLGSPGQVWPVDSTGIPGGAVITCSAPAFGVHNVPHTGHLVINEPDIADAVQEDAARWVGLRVRITGSGGTENGYYTILSAYGTGAAASFALGSLTEAVWARTFTPTGVTILGQRWYSGRMDVADWIQLGTDSTLTRSEIPYLTTRASVADSGTTRGDLPTNASSDEVVAEGTLSAIELVPTAYGVGVGDCSPLADMPGLSTVTRSAYTAEWQDDAQEPRAPIPNAASVDGAATHYSDSRDPGAYYSADAKWLGNPLWNGHPGSLVTGEILIEHRSMTGNSAFLGFCPEYGGCWVVQADPAGAIASGTAEISLWRRGAVSIPTASYALRAEVVLARDLPADVDATLSLRLCLADGTTLADSGSITVTTKADGVPVEVSHTFTAEELRDAPYDALAAVADQVHLVLDLTLDTGTSAPPRNNTWYILRCLLRQAARQAEVGSDLRVHGAVLAGEFRRTVPVLLPVPVGPMEALHLAGGAEWGKFDDSPHPTAPWEIERRGAGMLRDSTYDMWVRPTFPSNTFTLGPAAAAIIGSLYHDPLWYLTATGFDRTLCRPPGPTGMCFPLRSPTQGGRLMRLCLDLSFRPAFVTTRGVSPPGSNGDTVADLQVWRAFPDEDLGWATGTKADLQLRSAWEALAGVVVVIRRHLLLDTGVSQEDLSSGVSRVDAGYPEEILRYDVDMSGVSLPGFNANSQVSREVSKSVDINLPLQGVTADVLTADGRVYAYSASVEFYAGIRDIASGDATRYTDAVPINTGYVSDQQLSVDTGAMTVPVQGSFVAGSDDYPTADGTFGQVSGQGFNQRHPPVVKFRGAVALWSSDRLQ